MLCVHNTRSKSCERKRRLGWGLEQQVTTTRHEPHRHQPPPHKELLQWQIPPTFFPPVPLSLFLPPTSSTFLSRLQ